MGSTVVGNQAEIVSEWQCDDLLVVEVVAVVQFLGLEMLHNRVEYKDEYDGGPGITLKYTLPESERFGFPCGTLDVGTEIAIQVLDVADDLWWNSVAFEGEVDEVMTD